MKDLTDVIILSHVIVYGLPLLAVLIVLYFSLRRKK